MTNTTDSAILTVVEASDSFDTASLASSHVASRASDHAAVKHEQHTASHQKQPLSFKSLMFVFAGLASGVFFSSLDQTVVSTSLPVIASNFDALKQSSWVATAYLLTATTFQPLYGRLSDVFGRKFMFVFAIAIYILGAALCFSAQSMIWLIIARGITGIGGGGIMSLVLIIVSDLVSLRDRGKYQGILASVYAIATSLGPILGGSIVDHLGWRFVFFPSIPLGILTLCIILFGLKMPMFQGNAWHKLKRLDYPGALTLVFALTTLLLAINWGGQTFPWSSPVIISLFTSFAVFLVAFVLIECYLSVEPIVPMHLLKIRNVSLIFSINFLAGIVFLGIMFYGPMYFQIVRGMNATDSGIHMLPFILALVLCSLGSGAIITVFGRVKPLIVLAMLFLTVGTGLLFSLNINSTKAQEIVYFLLCGIGVGLHIQTTLISAQSSVLPQFMAIITALVNFFRIIGGVIGIALCGAILNLVVAHELPKSLSHVQGATPEIIQHVLSSLAGLKTAPELVRIAAQGVYMDGLHLAFLLFLPVAGVAFILSCFLRETPIRRKPLSTPMVSKEVKLTTQV